jgi:hypothetical protein
MKKLWITMTALSALAVTTPAAAQSWGSGAAIQVRVNQLETRLDAGVRRGTIPRSQAPRLRSQAQQLRQLEARYRVGGISSRERADLQMRIDNLDSQIRYAERWGYRYENRGWSDRNSDGWDDRDANRDGSWDVDRRYDRNDDGWDDRDTNRDGRWDNDQGYRDQSYGRDGRLDDRSTDRDGDGWDDRDRNRDGRLDYDPSYGPSYDGGDYDQGRTGYYDRDDRSDNGLDLGAALRVGVRAPAGLNAVPPEYRTRYRDGNGVYYRYDDGNIYQVDARTNVILRVYSLDR